ncbi:lipopolysaccharide heptosyltransferase II [Deltaproteobacteria bacterium Smac51]|nr:lipopolysaccharide heptosyltransferase II [Deltaproteobacteria bacterium Smac51]
MTKDSLPMDKILIVKMSALGDVIMALPALQALRKRYPEAIIDWLVEAPYSGVLTGDPNLSRVLLSPRQEMGQLVDAGKLTMVGRVFSSFYIDLRRVKYDVVIDLQGLLKSAFFAWLSHGKRKIGFEYSRERTGFFLNEKMPSYDPERHAVLRYLDAAVYLGAEMPNPLPTRYYTPPPEAVADAEMLLGYNGIDSNYIVLNPGAKWESKRWPLEHWKALAALFRRQGARLVITGGKGDKAWCDEIYQAAPKASLNLCGHTSLPILGAIMENSSLVVTADTGPMHLAAAVGAKGIAIFGPTRPWRTGPFGGRFKIITPDLDCLGCLRRVCDDPNKPCLAALSPETVFSAALSMIES